MTIWTGAMLKICAAKDQKMTMGCLINHRESLPNNQVKALTEARLGIST